MAYAIVQQDLSIPSTDALRQAFRSVPFLTDMDAFTLAADAYGVLVKRLTGEQAVQLQAALRRAGIEAEVVEERWLPPLPPTKFVRRLEGQPDGLMIYDPLGRAFRLDWGHLILIAAGNVRLVDFRRVQKVREVRRFHADGRARPERVVEASVREERNYHLSLELVLTRGVQRFSATADQFQFSCLGERRTNDATANFTLLVQDLIRWAPQAAVNRGAFYLRENAPEIFAYPSKNAFHEEITWLLWQIGKRVETGEGNAS